MLSKITHFTGFCWGSCLLLSLTAHGQQTTHPFASKANRTPEPIQARTLKPVVMNRPALAGNARIATTNHSLPFSRPLSLPTRLATVPDGFEVKKSARTGLPIFIKGVAPGSANARMDAQQA